MDIDKNKARHMKIIEYMREYNNDPIRKDISNEYRRLHYHKKKYDKMLGLITIEHGTFRLTFD